MECYGLTHKGMVRENNEDSYAVYSDGYAALPNLFIVADGMGGHQAGEVASQSAIEFFLAYIDNNKLAEDGVMDLLTGAVQYANEKVYEKARTARELFGMGTTLTACVMDNGRLNIAHVGDSRLYVIEGNSLRQITSDHTYVYEMVKAGHITPEEALVHPRRNALTKAIGIDSMVGADGYIVECTEDSLVLICSDGLTNMVSEDEIINTVKLSDGLESCAEKLIENANKNGGIDNITVVLTKAKRWTK